MPPLRLLSAVIIAGLASFFAGCSTAGSSPSSLATVRKVFVVETPSSGVTEADALANAVHDAAVHELGHHGYVATTNAGEAQATLRSSWRVNKADDGRVSLALSVSLFDPQGHRLLTADSGTTLSVNFWNEASVHRAVEQALSRLPKAAPAASSQK